MEETETAAPADLVTEETPVDAMADTGYITTPPEAIAAESQPAPFVPDFNSPEIAAMREQLSSRRAQQAAEAMTLEEALGVLPLRIRGEQFYIQEPTVRQEFLLRKHLGTLGIFPKTPGVIYPEVDEDPEKAELALVEAIRPFICRYVPEKRDIVPITSDEAPDILGRRAIRDVIRAVFGPPPAEGTDPNA